MDVGREVRLRWEVHARVGLQVVEVRELSLVVQSQAESHAEIESLEVFTEEQQVAGEVHLGAAEEVEGREVVQVVALAHGHVVVPVHAHRQSELQLAAVQELAYIFRLSIGVEVVDSGFIHLSHSNKLGLLRTRIISQGSLVFTLFYIFCFSHYLLVLGVLDL